VLEQQNRSSGGRLALAIAAGLALLAAGSVFAFRQPLMNLVAGFYDGVTGSSYADGLAAGRASNPVASSQAAPAAAQPAEASLSSPSAPTAAAIELETANAPASAAAPSTGAAGTAEAAPTQSAQSSVESTPAPPPSTASQASTSSATAMPAPATASPSAGTAAGAAAPASSQAKQVAHAEPPRSQIPPPPPRRIAVVAMGDSAVTGPARQRIEAQLMRLGFDVADSELLGIHDGASLPQVLNRLRSKVAAVVVVRAEPIGSQQLNYYGQSSTLYSVHLGVRAFAVGDERPLGAGWREKVDFTTLNAEIKALESIEPRLDSLVDMLADYRPRGRS
jgi:eukaryotic-like serine/threonine-protein kinase